MKEKQVKKKYLFLYIVKNDQITFVSSTIPEANHFRVANSSFTIISTRRLLFQKQFLKWNLNKDNPDVYLL